MTLTGSGADAPARVGCRLRSLHSQGRLRRSGSGTKSDVLRAAGKSRPTPRHLLPVGRRRLFIEAVELRDLGWGTLLRARQEMLFGSGSRAIYRRLSRSVAVFLRTRKYSPKPMSGFPLARSAFTGTGDGQGSCEA